MFGYIQSLQKQSTLFKNNRKFQDSNYTNP